MRRGVAVMILSAAGLIVSPNLTAQVLESKSQLTADERIRKLEEAVLELQKQNEELRKLLLNQPGTPPPSASPPATSAPSSAPPAAVTETPRLWNDHDVRFFWKEGLNFESGDGKTFKGKLGGRLQYDVMGLEGDKTIDTLAGDLDITTGFRRARLYNSGEILESAHYMLQMDFAGGDFKFTDAYVGLKNIPYVGTLQLGQMYEPFSLEQLTSDNYVTFPERAAPIEAFSPGRNAGAMVQSALLNDRMTYALGVFADDKQDKINEVPIESNARLTGRVTGLLWHDEQSKGRRYVHVGAGGSVINPEDDTVRYRARPEAHLAPRYIDTGNFTANMAYLGNLEALVTWESVSLQGEYFQTSHDASENNDPTFNGWYIFGSWFPTGEHRPYRKSTGAIDRIKPIRDFSFSSDGWGAFEILGRISRVKLDHHDINGGRLTDYTAGLGWYLTPNARFIFNYIYSDLHREGQEGQSHLWQTRFQIDF